MLRLSLPVPSLPHLGAYIAQSVPRPQCCSRAARSALNTTLPNPSRSHDSTASNTHDAPIQALSWRSQLCDPAAIQPTAVTRSSSPPLAARAAWTSSCQLTGALPAHAAAPAATAPAASAQPTQSNGACSSKEGYQVCRCVRCSCTQGRGADRGQQEEEGAKGVR